MASHLLLKFNLSSAFEIPPQYKPMLLLLYDYTRAALQRKNIYTFKAKFWENKKLIQPHMCGL